MIWPSFLASKQIKSYFKNIYLQRQNAVDVNRRTISLDILRERGKVVWTGSPGIGKSCDINFILIESVILEKRAGQVRFCFVLTIICIRLPLLA